VLRKLTAFSNDLFLLGLKRAKEISPLVFRLISNVSLFWAIAFVKPKDSQTASRILAKFFIA
jgi:hypothetical protein